MLRQEIVAERILDVVRAHHECALSELIPGLPELSWYEIFDEVNRLNRSGRLRLSDSSLGLTTILHSL
jgi:hypothetical protein